MDGIAREDIGLLCKTPAVALNADDRLEVFMMGKEDQLYHTWQTTRDTSTDRYDWYSEWEMIKKTKKTPDGKTEIEKWPTKQQSCCGA